ncbi:testis-expressed protein 2 [Asparagus officinalis]|uniref:testis-expressed protein 2 n=1 Tax=Asparagus officinalis TaxID=4686 RepID=UPI00098E4044|nr:testis-expressed protein 2 [Asparagus officinalis]
MSDEAPDTTNRIDVTSSKVRGFLKKFAKKASKNGVESKPASVSSSTRGERRIGQKIGSMHEVSSIDESVKGSSDNASNYSLQDLVQPGSPTTSKSILQIFPDSVCSEKILNDSEGTLCWNLLFSRLFFDAKRSIGLNDAVKARIQTLSNMRTPGYIGGVTCTSLDLGDLPPFIHRMRVLPVDLTEVWAVEVDIEYSGGIVLDVETRIDVCEQELQNEDLNKSLGLSSAREVTSDLIEETDYNGKQLEFPRNSADQMENKDEGGDRVDGLKQSKSTKWASNYASRWKAAVNSIANRVAQVPISLAIRVASLRGTLRLHIKPPPSDQLWFGFTTMPEIEWNLDSSVGDQRITSSHIALLIGNRFKASIRDNLVLPNCESICIPFMLAEKDDWVPRNVAPFIWINQEAMDMTGLDSSSSVSGEARPLLDSSTRTKSDNSTRTISDNITIPDDKVETIEDVVHIQPKPDKSESKTSVSTNRSIVSCKSEELREPLLREEGNREGQSQSKGESPKSSSASSENLILDVPTVRSEEDIKRKKISSRRARMMDLGKKMGEKLEEKRRLIEERSRHVVEKMRENTRT